jgi:uncharacterized protein YndB with AHSA1/START domain
MIQSLLAPHPVTSFAAAVFSCALLGPAWGDPAGAEAPSGSGERDAASAAVDTSPLVLEADLNARVEKVWAVFTTSEGHKMLGVAQARIDFRVGGKMLTHYDPKGVLGDDNGIENTILSYEPMRSVSFAITKPPKSFPFMNAYRNVWWVASMEDIGGGRTHLRLAGMGFTADPESQGMRAFFQRGNAWVMQKLAENLAATAPGDPGGAGSAAVGSAAVGSAPAGSASAFKAAADTPGSPAASEAPPNDPLAPIHTEVVVSAPVSEVWHCWTTSEGIGSFLTNAHVELRIGGPFEIYFGGADVPEGQRGSEGCKVLSYEPERMLSFSWNAPPKFGPLREERTWVVVRLESEAAGTKVTLTHLGFAERAAEAPADREKWGEVRAYFSHAWPSVLAALQGHFAAPQKS